MSSAAIPVATALGGSVLSGIGGSGKQGEERASRSGTSNASSTATRSDRGESIRELFELPELKPFRNKLLEVFGGELDRAQEPVFGEAQTAGFLNTLNDVSKSASDRIIQSLARRGALRSGSGDRALRDVELNRASQAGEFFSELPFKERQARQDSVNPLLDLGFNFAGRGPTQGRTTTTGDTDIAEQSDRSFDEESLAESFGPSFGRSLASSGGGLLGQLFSEQLFRGKGNPFS